MNQANVDADCANSNKIDALKARVAKLEELVEAQDKTIQDLRQQVSYQLTKERQLARDLRVGKKKG
jgi:uncharacterized coiled-coil protein SlyX